MAVRMAVVAGLTIMLAGCAAITEGSTAIIEVGTDLEFQVEVADSPDEQRAGLSSRDELPENTGMLFTFDVAGEHQVWMAGMKTPIDVAWILDNHVVAVDTLDPCTAEADTDCPRWTSLGDADALLELPAGSLEGVKPGTAVTIRENEPHDK